MRKEDWQNIYYSGVTTERRCGWEYYSPNAVKNYDFANKENYVETDCADWTPERSGEVKIVNCELCGCSERGANKLWMQSLPGVDNVLITSSDQKLRN